jgi:hypothetical protein
LDRSFGISPSPLAESWRDFDGLKEYLSLEGELRIACTHDGRATVQRAVTVRQPGPPKWSLTAELQFGAGAHLKRIADAVETFA